MFHMFIAQLITMHRNDSSPHILLSAVLESIRVLREQYEQHGVGVSWESNEYNSIGMSMELENLPLAASQAMYLLIFSGHSNAVVEHLLNLSFWVTSLQANSLFLGNLTNIRPLSLTIENFDELIDNGAPSPSESGFDFQIFSSYYDITHTKQGLFVTINGFYFIYSDECLAEILNSVHCTISGRCLQIMSLNNESHGYHLTHKYVHGVCVLF